MGSILVALEISKYTIVVIIGMLFFGVTLKYSNSIFDWIENQTFSTRNYILEKMEILFWDIPEQKISYF